jgi:prepilin-type N-terminal cleavage/methylation domain-containing protein
MAVKCSIDPGSLAGRRRRGVTLVEMLVTLAVLLILMTIIVRIFGAATGSLSGAQAYQELDNKLRQLDVTLRTDLRGVTARMTPPLDPKDNLGYFEYGENAFADQQGEDSDDYIRFTAKAPEGKPFVGRFWPLFQVNPPNGPWSPHLSGPITITSQFAEIIYFLRNGNLYRRVFLVAPERQSSIAQMIGNVSYKNGVNNGFYYPGTPQPYPGYPLPPPNYPLGTTAVSWLGMNDLSARPAPNGTIAKTEPASIILNTLGDLTNRENRAFAPRFANDFQHVVPGPPATLAQGPDNRVDDFNPDNIGNPAGDGVPDYYPTLYPGVFAPINSAPLIYELKRDPNGNLIPNPPISRFATTEAMAFPYIFPGAYSKPEPADPAGAYGNGWIHSPNPDQHNPFANANATALVYLQRLNHSPLDQGDNLPRPGPLPSQAQANTAFQTWWGFPTWRETLSANWTDPTVQVNDYVNNPNGQPNGLHPRHADPLVGLVGPNDALRVVNDGNLLPAMTLTANSNGVSYPVRLNEQPFTDGWGRDNAQNNVSPFWNPALWNATWEDDLIATGVRSFDVKAYDPALGQYVDLGWGDDLRFAPNFIPGPVPPPAGVPTPAAYPTHPPYLYVNFNFFTDTLHPAGGYYLTTYLSTDKPHALLFTNGAYFDLLTQTMAHEGRIPPLMRDHRLDDQFPNKTYITWAPVNVNFIPQYPAPFQNYSSNIGDDNPATIRLRRVWDTWSTDYSRAKANGIDPISGFPIGPNAYPPTPPVYPSYPPPYPAPLRSIQIQIRVADPVGQHVKVLTIRQDFTDKL